MAHEIPFPESDAREIANPSIDSGLKAGTHIDSATDMLLNEDSRRILADIGEDPTPAGPDLVAQTESPIQRLLDQPIVSDIRQRAGALIEDLPARSRDAAQRVQQTAKANPWLTIAAASAGALVAGFIIGKLLKPSAASYTEEEYPAGYDE